MADKKPKRNKSSKCIDFSLKLAIFVTIIGVLIIVWLFIREYDPLFFEPFVSSINDFLGRLGL